MNPTQPQNQQPAQPGYQQNIIIVGKQKSVGVAFILAFFFGPLGLLYSSVVGGIVMFFAGIIIAIITLGLGLIIVWIGCIIWAIVAVNNANSKIASSVSTNINVGNPGNIQQPYTLTPAATPLPPATETPIVPPAFPASETPTYNPYEKTVIEPQLQKQPKPFAPAAPVTSLGTPAKGNPLGNKNYLLTIALVVGVVIIAGGIYIFNLKRRLAGKESFFSTYRSSTANSTVLADSAKMADSVKMAANSSAVIQAAPQTSNTGSASDNSRANVNGLYPQSSQRLLTPADLASLSKYDLKIMRNEIFARHGYIFKTPEMIAHFAGQSWYKPEYNDVTNLLSEIEKQNVELIKSYEK